MMKKYVLTVVVCLIIFFCSVLQTSNAQTSNTQTSNTQTSNAQTSNAQTSKITKEVIYPYGTLQPTDPELNSLEWNRYTTENFTILSIDNAQGKWLSDNIENIKKWCVIRWGFTDFRFTKECRIFCVPNKRLMKKLFNLEQSKVEIRRKNGQLEISAMWLVLDDKPARTVPMYMTQVCMAEFEARHNVTLSWWFQRGMSHLNGVIPDVRRRLVSLSETIKKDQHIFISEKMLTMTEEEYLKLSTSHQDIFDQQSVALCLLMRREFGEVKLQRYLRITSKNNSQDVLRVVYGFESYTYFDKSYVRYMRDLTSEILANKTPDSYLEIRPVK